MTRMAPAALERLKTLNPCHLVAARWVALRPHGASRMIGPCPLHSPDPQARDSTSFECWADGWVCATCQDGGDVIRLIARRQGLDPERDFRAVLALLEGGADALAAAAPAPQTQAERQARAEEAAARAVEQNDFRDRERRSAWDLYYGRPADNGRPAIETFLLAHPRAAPAREYLELRGLDWRGLKLRCNPAARFYLPDRPRPRLIHTGPALLGLIQRGGRFAGVHSTFIDLAQPKGKARLIDPKSNAALDAKKVRGAMKGGHVDLTGCAAPATLVLGEGAEKTIAVRDAFIGGGRDTATVAFWSAMNLGNLGGKHAGLVPHPERKTPSGRVQRVPGPQPDRAAPALEIPDGVTLLVLLGDSTSDPFATACALARARARYERLPDPSSSAVRDGSEQKARRVVAAMAPSGVDFDDLLREAKS